MSGKIHYDKEITLCGFFGNIYIYDYIYEIKYIDTRLLNNKFYYDRIIEMSYKNNSLSAYFNDLLNLEIFKNYYDGKRFHIKNIQLLFNKKYDLNISHILKKIYYVYSHHRLLSHFFIEKPYGKIFLETAIEHINDLIIKYKKLGYRSNIDPDMISYKILKKQIIKKYDLIKTSNKFISNSKLLNKLERFIAVKLDLQCDRIKTYSYWNATGWRSREINMSTKSTLPEIPIFQTKTIQNVSLEPLSDIYELQKRKWK